LVCRRVRVDATRRNAIDQRAHRHTRHARVDPHKAGAENGAQLRFGTLAPPRFNL
jgi:hypothetical protein